MNAATKRLGFCDRLEVASPFLARTLIAALALVFCAAPSYAQYKLCFPNTQWFGSLTGAGPSLTNVEDPAWLGSFRYVFGNGTNSAYAVVQGVRDSSNNLYLSVEGESLPSLTGASDLSNEIIIAFDFRSSGGQFQMISVKPVINNPTIQADPASVVGVNSGPAFFYTSSTLDGFGHVMWTSSQPSWLGPKAGYWQKPANDYHWFLAVKLPITGNGTPGNGITLPTTAGSTFGLYVNVFRVVNNNYQESEWPPSAPVEPGCSSVGSCTPEGNDEVPVPGNWGTSTIDPTQSCGGVSVGSQNNDIFTNNFPNSLICLQNTAAPNCSSNTPNIFTAKVTNTTVNGSGTFQPAPNVQATFSIANFGLHPTWDPTQWTKINVANNPTTPPVTIGIPPNNSAPLSTQSWYPVQPNASLYDPVTGHPHQCIMVTLDSTSGNVDFINNAAIQNMDFVNTSKFERTAEISAKGYPPRYNPDGTPASDQIFDLRFITSHEVLGQGQTTSATYPAQAGPVQVTERGKVTSQFTWIAQGCRHTGRFMTVDERKIEICDPVGGFGYVMRHAGATAVKDWKIRFTGSGLEPVPGQKNTYQIHIPQGGVANVKTYANPQEEGTGKVALFLDAGAAIPQGTFGSAFNKGFSFNAGLEYILHPHFSAEGIFGYHHFPGTITSALNIYQFSVNGKTYLTNGPFRPFVNGGVGGYKFGSGSTYFGGNVGAGVLYSITSRVGVQGSYNFHAIKTPVTTKFSVIEGGLRFVF